MQLDIGLKFSKDSIGSGARSDGGVEKKKPSHSKENALMDDKRIEHKTATGKIK
jgi:hypothetical protein